MKRIGITQRVDEVGAYKERRDCLDQRWVGLLASVGCVAIPVPNSLEDPGSWLDLLGVEGLVLSGGNDLASLPGAVNEAPERDRTESRLLAWAEENRAPVLGVCRGLQMIAVNYGGRLEQVAKHAGTRHLVQATQDCVWLPSDTFEVNSYHHWGLSSEGLGSVLVVGAFAEDGTIEALQHRLLPFYSIMWHPERESSLQQHDRRLLQRIFQ